MFRGLLVPVDAPDDFDSVRPAVESLAAVFAAEVLLLHVLDPQEAAADRLMRSYEGPRSYDGPLDSIPTDYRAEAEDGLNELAAGLRDAGLTVSTQVIEGHPAPVIGAAAGERRGTLVIIATHARTGVARWVLGSVTDKVFAVRMTRSSCFICAGEVRPPGPNVFGRSCSHWTARRRQRPHAPTPSDWQAHSARPSHSSTPYLPQRMRR